MRTETWLKPGLILIAAALLLSGCGYQLKGQFRFADGLSPLVWQADGDQDELFLTTRDIFAIYGLVLSESPADTLLQVHRVDDNSVELSEAEVLALEIEWSLVNGEGATVISHRRTRAETRLSLSPEVDEDDAREERQNFLRQRIALRLLDQLEAVSTAELNQSPDAR